MERRVEVVADVSGARKLLQRVQIHVLGDCLALSAASRQFGSLHMKRFLALATVDRFGIASDGTFAPMARLFWCL
jgi:hypothetical protein